MFKLTRNLQGYSSLWHNPAICIVYWKQWHSRGISTIGDLYEDGVFRSYNNIKERFGLVGEGNFWKYLQIRSCVTSNYCKVTDNIILNYLELPRESHKASQFYKIINSFLGNDSVNVKIIWQRDLGEEIEDDKWSKIVADCGKYVKEARGKFTQYKVLHRYYFTPSRLHRMKLLNNNVCRKCKTEVGTFLHCIWECRLVKPLWIQVLEILSSWFGSEVPLRPMLCLLGDRSQIPNISKCTFSVIIVSLMTVCRVILRHWKETKAPDLKEWVN